MAKELVKVYFEGELVKEPVICELGRTVDVVPNILRADVEGESGWIVLELEGSEIALQEALEYLKDRGVRPERTQPDDLPP